MFILIVDKDAAWRGQLRRQLEDLGHASMEADSLQDAYRLSTAHQFSAVILDDTDCDHRAQGLLELWLREDVGVIVLSHTPAHEIIGLLGRQGVYYLPKMASVECLNLLLESVDPTANLRMAL